MFITREAFKQTIPYHTIKEDNMWFRTSKDKKTAYIFINENNWIFGERKTFSISELSTSKSSQISVLGQNGKVLEYKTDVDPAPKKMEKEDGIEIFEKSKC